MYVGRNYCFFWLRATCKQTAYFLSSTTYLFCKHIFHYECLKDWLNKNILMPKCPNCNYNVLTGGEINLNNHNPNNLPENNGDNNQLHSSITH